MTRNSCYSLISMSTPAGRFRRMSARIVLPLGSRTSIRRLCVRISNCSCESLSMNGDRITQNFSIRVGSGTGPATLAPVASAVSTILPVLSARWLSDLLAGGPGLKKSQANRRLAG